MSIGNFTEKGFIREGGSISFQERAVKPSDFTQKRGYEYASEKGLLNNAEELVLLNDS